MVKLAIRVGWLSFASALERELSANLADEEYTVKKAMLREGLDFSAKENMGIVARVLYCMPDAEEQSEEQSEEKVYLNIKTVSIQDQEELRSFGDEVNEEEAENIKAFFGNILEWGANDVDRFASQIAITRGKVQQPLLKVEGNTELKVDGSPFTFSGKPGRVGRIRFLEEDTDTKSIYDFFAYIYRSSESCPQYLLSRPESRDLAAIAPYDNSLRFRSNVKSSTAKSALLGGGGESWDEIDYVIIAVVVVLVSCCVLVLICKAISRKKEHDRALKQEKEADANSSPRLRRGNQHRVAN